MPDERNIAHDKKVLEEKEKHGDHAEIEGENPEHAPQPGKKTPQEKVDKNAIDESGELIQDDRKDKDELN